MNAAEITDKLGLHSLRQRSWYIQAACATSGDGLYEGLEWVSDYLLASRMMLMIRSSLPTLRGRALKKLFSASRPSSFGCSNVHLYLRTYSSPS